MTTSMTSTLARHSIGGQGVAAEAAALIDADQAAVSAMLAVQEVAYWLCWAGETAVVSDWPVSAGISRPLDHYIELIPLRSIPAPVYFERPGPGA
jgi:hypothetical protein